MPQRGCPGLNRAAGFNRNGWPTSVGIGGRIASESLAALRRITHDDRPWGGTDPPGVVYIYAPDRKAERPISHLAGFKGVLQVDGYGGYRVLAERGDVQLAFCWSHVRRRFYELAAAGPAPIANEALKRIVGLYAVEKEIRGRSADERRHQGCQYGGPGTSVRRRFSRSSRTSRCLPAPNTWGVGT